VRHALFAGASLVLVCSTLPALATPGNPVRVPAARAKPAATPSPRPLLAPSSLYARRTRRLVQSYLRLKLLEAREADLDRARKVVERKLGIRWLFGETPAPDAR
jgi:hypothetical protein